MAETKYTITVAGEPFLRPGATLTIETNEIDFEKVLDDLLNKAYDLDHLLGTLEKLSEATKDLSATVKSWKESNAEYRKDLQHLKTETQAAVDAANNLPKKD
ncbi:MAG: hypothetical protein AAB885_00670 [Patescibacteria group bacterium]